MRWRDMTGAHQSDSWSASLAGCRLPPSELAELEREYVAHRASVLAMLRSDFRGLDDAEELYHDAWEELLEMRTRGERPRHVRGLLKTIAWRRARDRIRDNHSSAVDPAGPILGLQADSAPSPDEQVQVRLDGAAIRQIVEGLDPRQAAVLKLRFDWGLGAGEIRERLGITQKRFEKIVAAAYENVAAALAIEDGETQWTKQQRSLLLACEMGLASAAQRARAQRMVDEDVHCRAMLFEMRSALRDVAAVLPAPVLFEEHRHGIGVILDRATDAWASAKQAVAGLAGRSGTSGSLEQATSAGAGLGGGAAAKLIVACLAAGGTATACYEAGFLRAGDPTPPIKAKIQRRAAPPKPKRVATIASRAPVTPKPPRRKSVSNHSSTVRTKASSPKYKPPPSPAPTGSTEFGPGAVGSTSATAQPAAAPSNGGGEFTP